MDNLKEYNIGLDIGVASVGWAVTDGNCDLIKRQNRNLWGSRIFSEAETAAGRRSLRSARRRIERRRERINMLQSLLQDDMEIEYPNFFQRLRNSSLIYADKEKSIFNDNYNLFDEEYLNDENYYGRFPTIYHLRNELVQNTEKQDFRMVYLALHHIIKYRGNFLYEGDFTTNSDELVKESLNAIIEYMKMTNEIDCDENNFDEILRVLKSKEISKKDKIDEIKKYFSFDKESKAVLDNVLNAIVGYKFDLSKIFKLDNAKKIKFSSDVEEEDELINELKEDSEIYYSMKNVYSWGVLQSILDIEEGNEFNNISKSFINKFEKHKKDLKLLKEIYKTYYLEEYDDMFRKNLPNNYVSFRGKVLKNQEICKCDSDEFYKIIKSKIAGLPDSYAKKKEALRDVENDNFLKKLNTTDNGAIPHQLHGAELEKIIDNQSKYYKTLAESKDKIISIFNYRIPYYVGPLGNKKDSEFSWVIRKSDEKVRPWNIDEIVDKHLTAEEFIKRMTNKCTYLLNEDVMPKNSLLYSRFCVLNELNNIRIISEDKSAAHLDKKTKAGIINNVFMKKKSVNKKDIINYLNNNGMSCEMISGLSDNNNFNSNLSSYIDMKRIFKDAYTERNFEMYETLIYWITIFKDKKILKEKIEKTYKGLSPEIVSQLVKLKYSDWSRLSKQLLIGEKSYQNESIMDILENTKLNFMQIINEPKFGFDKIIEKQLSKHENRNFNYEDDIAILPTSPANKRAIWQSLKVVEEIARVTKCPPKRIYIEFARNEGEKALKDKRAEKLLKLYDEFLDRNNEVYENLKKVQKDKNISERMYLYFMQNGKCMYSGESLVFEELSSYEVDHIVPRSYIKDDSFDNKALVKRELNQCKKDNLLLKDSIIDERTPYWKNLLNNGLISQTKYSRLIKRNMLETDEEKVKFVNRQLVETRQTIKQVVNFLKNYYEDTEIYAIRAEVTSGIRSKYGFYKNRNVNDYHHAHDAYLLCNVGNIIESNLKYKDEYQYGEYVKKYFKESQEKGKEKNGNGALVGLVSKYIDHEKVRKILNYKDCYLSRMLEERTGDFYDQTIYKKKPGLIRKKENLPTEIYGGYKSKKTAYMCIYGYKDKKENQKYNLVGIPVKIAMDIKNKKITLEGYIKSELVEDKEYSDFEILKNKIFVNQQYMDENGEIMRLVSGTEFRADIPLILNDNLNKFVNLINREFNKLKENEIKYIDSYWEKSFDDLLEILKTHYKVFDSTIKKIESRKKEYMDTSKENKKAIINGLICLMKTGQGDLSVFGMDKQTGRVKDKNFNEKKLAKMTFIDKSITGIYERRYKINGVEDNTSK